MTKITKKAAAEYCTSKRFDAFVVYPNGTRGTHFGGVNPLELLTFMAHQNRIGNRVIVTEHGVRSLYGVLYPEMGITEASSFSMRDAEFGEKVTMHAISLTAWTR